MPMPPLHRKAYLVIQRTTVAAIARELGLSHGHVSQVLHGLRRHEQTEIAIAKKIGRPVSEVFPPNEDEHQPFNAAVA